jgi:hypothetical protein
MITMRLIAGAPQLHLVDTLVVFAAFHAPVEKSGSGTGTVCAYWLAIHGETAWNGISCAGSVPSIMAENAGVGRP